MKIKTVLSIGAFFIFLQFTTVQLFSQMLSISESHNLPIQEVQRYQVLIMKAIYGSLLLWGLLSLILVIWLLIAMIIQPGKHSAKLES